MLIWACEVIILFILSSPTKHHCPLFIDEYKILVVRIRVYELLADVANSLQTFPARSIKK
jgi:hypothetical protein